MRFTSIICAVCAAAVCTTAFAQEPCPRPDKKKCNVRKMKKEKPRCPRPDFRGDERCGYFRPGPEMDEALICPEVRMQIMKKMQEINELRRAEIAKRRAEMEKFNGLLDQYREKKDDAVRKEILAILGARFDRAVAVSEQRIAEHSAALAKEKARKTEIIEKQFNDIVSGKPAFGKRPPRQFHPQPER